MALPAKPLAEPIPKLRGLRDGALDARYIHRPDQMLAGHTKDMKEKTLLIINLFFQHG
jgi:hypothetical protein